MNKTTFKILLDSTNTSSYIGTNQYDALQYVNLNSILNDEDLKKSYYVYINFRSVADRPINNKIGSGNRYYLNLNFNKSSDTIQYTTSARPYKNIVTVLPVEHSIQEGSTSTTIRSFLNLNISDQEPFILNNLQGITQIGLQVLLASTYIPIVPSSATNSRYACLLNFVEI